MSCGELQEHKNICVYEPRYLQSLVGVCVAVEDRIIGYFSEAASGSIWQEDRPCRELSALGAWEGTCVSRRSEFLGSALALVVGTCQFTRCCLDDIIIAPL